MGFYVSNARRVFACVLIALHGSMLLLSNSGHQLTAPWFVRLISCKLFGIRCQTASNLSKQNITASVTNQKWISHIFGKRRRLD